MLANPSGPIMERDHALELEGDGRQGAGQTRRGGVRSLYKKDEMLCFVLLGSCS